MKGNAATSRGKLALRFGACIAAGMLLTVLVSWACALWSPTRLELQMRSTASRVPVLDSGTLLMPHRPRPPQTLEIPEPLRRWVPDEWLRTEAANDPPGSFLGADHTRMRGFGLLVHTIDIHVFVADGIRVNPDIAVHTFRAGWPARSLLGVVRVTWDTSSGGLVPLYHWEYGLPVTDRFAQRSVDATNFKLFANEPCRPPLLPLWPGFIINTAFYSAFFVAIWIVPELVRPYYRRRRNLCPACGYDLRGLAAARCPECGRDATSTQPKRP